jgi:predicted RNase H-like nuclease (RuvC/YqgF family)
LTPFPARRYDRCDGGPPIPERERYDFERLERAVEALAKAHRRLRDENSTLRRKVEEKGRRIRALEGRLLEANQRRQDVAKRIDELIAQVNHLDAQLAQPEE